MGTSWRGWITLSIGLTMISAHPMMATGQEDIPFVLADHQDDRARRDPRTMTQAEWQAIAQKVSMNLHLLGIQLGATPQELAIFVPTFTHQYLQAFQFALLQGANRQQADILATQHIFAHIQQLAARSGAGGQRGDGCVYSRGGSMCSGSDGFLGFSFR